ncbi:MAG: multiple sugar transport system permease protein [Actinomycetota bacterium]|nr:multiple sugar transport system permease protein [Actinomycetota bacterium]
MAQAVIDGVEYRPPKRGIKGVLREMRREWTAYLFNAPGLILFCVFVIYALYTSFSLSFHQWDILQPNKPFVGLQNYREVFHDSAFWASIGHTIYYVVGTVPVEMAVGLGLALLLNAKLRALGIFRTAYYLPVITPLVVAAIIWKWVYQGDFGLLNFYLLKFHLISHPLLWLSDEHLAMPAVIIMIIWKSSGFNAVIYLAGLQAIPNEFYEAAAVDGAGGWQRFRRITFPLVAPTTFFLLIINVIGGTKDFASIFVMTNGGPPGPGGATTTVVYYIYTQAFKFFRMGYASALAYTLFVLLFIVSFAQFRWYMRQVESD